MLLPQNQKVTLADLLFWEEESVELISGVPFLMAPPSRQHQKIVTELLRQLANFLEGKQCQVYPAPFAVRLFETADIPPEQVDTLVEPDLSVICDPNKLDNIGCKGAPDFVIEVLSPSSQRHDRLVKLGLYQQAGIPEYWIVDPENQTVQVCLLHDGIYRVTEVYSQQDIAKVTTLEGCFIQLNKVFDSPSEH